MDVTCTHLNWGPNRISGMRSRFFPVASSRTERWHNDEDEDCCTYVVLRFFILIALSSRVRLRRFSFVRVGFVQSCIWEEILRETRAVSKHVLYLNSSLKSKWDHCNTVCWWHFVIFCHSQTRKDALSFAKPTDSQLIPVTRQFRWNLHWWEYKHHALIAAMFYSLMRLGANKIKAMGER